MGAFSLPKVVLLLIMAFLIFGSTKLSTLGKDLGGAIRDFRKALQEEEPAAPSESATTARPATADSRPAVGTPPPRDSTAD